MKSPDIVLQELDGSLTKLCHLLETDKSDERDVATRVVRILRDAGAEAVFAGGAVRDTLMGETPNDFDVATDFTPDQVEALFPHTIPVGKAFGVIIVRDQGVEIEVATFQKRHPEFTCPGFEPL